MRIFRTQTFTRFARKARLTDAMLSMAVDDVMRGLIEADLGSFVLK